MKTHLYLLTLIVLIGCNQQEKKAEDAAKIENRLELLPEPDKGESEESLHYSQSVDSIPAEFISFYEKFITDSVFQLKHIRFPLEGGIYECEETFNWVKSEWRFMNLDFRKDFYNELDNNTISYNNTSLIYKNYRKEIGLLSEMRFEKINDIWYLVFFQVNAC